VAVGEPPQQHPLLAPLVFLLGVWEGEGRGLWPAEPPFRYRERVEMTHQGGPFVAYRQTTTTPDASRSLHTEAGFVRAGPGGTVEMVVAQATGLVEVHAGSITGRALRLESTTIGRTPTALTVTKVIRAIQVIDDVLTYRVDIGMHDEPAAPHLEARLRRIA
jgi:hypothetical protein